MADETSPTSASEMTSPRLAYSREDLLRHRNQAAGPLSLPRSLRRALWFLRLLKPSHVTRNLSCQPNTSCNPYPCVTPLEARSIDPEKTRKTSVPPTGAGDREVHHHRAQAEPNLRSLHIGTLNCRTLKARWRQGMLAHLAYDLRFDLMMIQEHSLISSPGVHQLDLGGAWTLHFTTADARGHGGVGVMVSPRLRSKVIVLNISERVLRVDIKLKSRNAHFFCVYSPTSSYPSEAADFLECLNSQLDALPRRDTTVLLGDFNAVLRPSIRHTYTLGAPNANSEGFTDFLSRNDLISINTQFRKSHSQLTTFVGPKRPKRNQRERRNAKTRFAQLDHIVLRLRERRRIKDCNTLGPKSFTTDHKLVHCTINLAEPLYKPPKRSPRRCFSRLSDWALRRRFEISFTRAMEASDASTNSSYSKVVDAVRSASTETVPLVRPSQSGAPVWETNAEVRRARDRVISLRQAGLHAQAAEATSQLAQIYEKQVHLSIDSALKCINAPSNASLQNTQAWRIINGLTGRKNRSQPNVIGNSPSARLEKVQTFFSNIVNAEPSPSTTALSLPDNTSLPSMEDFNISPITFEEVMRAARESRCGKSMGPDEMPPEVLRLPKVVDAIVPIMNSILDGGPAPPEWRKSLMVAVPKKPGTVKIEEHRGISLMSTAAKTFNKVLLRRLLPVLNPFLRPEQNGFRPQRGTCQQILSLRRIIEGATKYQTPAVIVFVDFQRAFDSIDRRCIGGVLSAYNVPPRLTQAITAMYHNTSASVLTADGETAVFNTSSGVLQGDTLAPFLFILMLDWVLRVAIPDDSNGFLISRKIGKRHPEQRVSVLGYADDLALVSCSSTGAQTMLNNLVAAAHRVGLRVNPRKTEVLHVPGPNINISLEGKTLAVCNKFSYLGGQVPCCRDDFRHRKSLAWLAFNRLRVVFNSKILSDCLRAKLFAATIETVLLYNAVTWTLTRTLEEDLDAAHSRLLRAAFNIRWPERVRNIDLYKRAGLCPPSERLRHDRLAQAGLVIRSEASCPQPRGSDEDKADASPTPIFYSETSK